MLPASKSAQIFSEYWPDQPRNRNIPGTCLAGANAVFELEGFTRVFGGWRDTSETNTGDLLPYTATVGATSVVELSGGATARTDLMPTQHILLGDMLHLVTKVVDDTHIEVDPRPTNIPPSPGVEVRRLPDLHAVAPDAAGRLSAWAGSLIQFRDLPIVGVGRGPVRFNGVAPTATPGPFILSNTPQMGYPKPDGTYEVRPMGFPKPAAGFAAVAVVGGGTKAMPAVRYQLRCAQRRKGFEGYGLLSDPVYVTLASVGDRIQVTFPAFDTASGSNQFRLFVSEGTDLEARLVKRLTTLDFDTVGPHTIEWYDTELAADPVIYDDNYPPPPALFAFSLNDRIGFASCYGPPDASGNPTAPGPGVAISKQNIPEAFPFTQNNVAFTSNGETICGIQAGKASLWVFTKNRINIGQLTGAGLVLLPYGQTGCEHQYSGVAFEDTLFAFSGDQLVWVSDKEGERNTYSTKVRSKLSRFENARCFTGFDPRNGWAVIMHSNAQRGSGGKWQTECLAFNVNNQKWQTPIILGDGTSADFTVCGCATVGNSLYFVTTDGKVWEWDQGTQTLVGFIGSGFRDFGSAEELMYLRRLKINGGIHGGVQIYTNYDYDRLVAGTGTSPTRTLTNPSFNPKHHPIWRPNRTGHSFALRFTFQQQARSLLLDDYSMVVTNQQGVEY